MSRSSTNKGVDHHHHHEEEEKTNGLNYRLSRRQTAHDDDSGPLPAPLLIQHSHSPLTTHLRPHTASTTGTNAAAAAAAAMATTTTSAASASCGSKYPVREWEVTIPGLQDPVGINPLVSLIGILGSWGVVLWIIVDPKYSIHVIIALRTYITLHFTWVFQGTKAVFFYFMMYITYRYGHIHMGQSLDEKPEYSSFATATMIFTAGVGSGLLAASVSESLAHRQGNFYAETGYRSQDEIDMFSINMTVTTWGITSWIPYSVVAVCMSLAAHRFRLPMTFRSCFYPILGAYTWGWIGDCIDGLSIVATITGICMNLGLSTTQIVSGLIFMDLVDNHGTKEHVNSIHNTTLWVLILIATSSMLSGVSGGIRLLSIVALLLSTLLLGLVLCMDDTKYLLNLVVQEVGFFAQSSLLQLNLWTDAFGQLREGSGRAIDGKAADQDWQMLWTVFYQSWIINYSVTIGIFAAYVSKGRKLWEIVSYCFFFPLGYCLMWFTIWGGIGLRQARQALELENLGLAHFNNSQHFLQDGSNHCYPVPQEDVVVDGNVVFSNHLLGVTPVCLFDPNKTSDSAFNVLYSFRYPDTLQGNGLGSCLMAIFILSCALYFVTSADSSALIMDSLASNGGRNRHWLRRVFWAATIGTVATSFVSSGGADVLSVAQSASVVCGLPLALLICYLIQSITLLCRAAEQQECGNDYQFPDQAEFSMPIYGGIFNAIEYIASVGKVNEVLVELRMDRPTRFQVVEFVKGLVVPFISLHQLLNSAYPKNPKTNLIVVASYAICYLVWVGFFLPSFSRRGFVFLVWTFFFASGAILCTLRSGYRMKYNLRSNFVGDVIASMFFWPQVLTQMRLHSQNVRATEMG